MKLQNADKALIQREKIADYLLNAAPPDNNGKAEFVESFGFRLDDWEALAQAFRRVASRTFGFLLDAASIGHGASSTTTRYWVPLRGIICPVRGSPGMVRRMRPFPVATEIAQDLA